MQKVIRTTHIGIHTPKPGSDNWIQAINQILELGDSGEILSERIADKNVYRRMDSNTLMDVIAYPSPVTGEMQYMLVAELAVAIKAAVIKWQLEDFQHLGAQFDPQTGWVKIDGAGS